MRANRSRDTGPERRLRAELHRLGLRFRKDTLIRLGDTRTRPDVVLSQLRVAVFIDGCFWHRCPLHASDPKANSEYWAPKLEANVARDRRVDSALGEAGWEVIRVWEHESPEVAAPRIMAAVERRRKQARAQGRAAPPAIPPSNSPD